MTHRKSVIAVVSIALLLALGFWHSAQARSNALSAISGTWHLAKVSDGRISVMPAKPASLEFIDASLKADDGTNFSTSKLVKANKHVFFFGSGSMTAVGYAPMSDARQALSRAPLQPLLFTRDAVTYMKTSAHTLMLRTGKYNYTLVK